MFSFSTVCVWHSHFRIHLTPLFHLNRIWSYHSKSSYKNFSLDRLKIITNQSWTNICYICYKRNDKTAKTPHFLMVDIIIDCILKTSNVCLFNGKMMRLLKYPFKIIYLYDIFKMLISCLNEGNDIQFSFKNFMKTQNCMKWPYVLSSVKNFIQF